jgi:phospholipase C
MSRPLGPLARPGPIRAATAILVGSLLALAACGEVPPSGSADRTGRPAATTPIKHVVILMKENRSFDSYFGRFPGADGATTGKLSNGTTVSLTRTPDPAPNDINHNGDSWQAAYDGGKMDGFDQEAGAYTASGRQLAYSQMRRRQIPNYWAYAKHYGLGDRFFADWKGPSFGNNLYSVAAQAGQYDSSQGNRIPYFIPVSNFVPRLSPWGCDSPPDTVVTMMSTVGDRMGEAFPCFNFPSLPNTLQNHGMSWDFYGAPGDQGYAHNALDALSSVRNNQAMWSHVRPIASFAKAASAGSLPAVSWIASAQNEHPPYSACDGENETVSFMNALMKGPDWRSTAVFIYWDEWGGFYDHVPPPQINAVSYGFRVPFIVISPWTAVGSSADGGVISHTLYSQASVLKFVEDNWRLPSLTPSDGSANDVMDMFDFHAPRKPKLILSTRKCRQLSRAERRLGHTRPTD